MNPAPDTGPDPAAAAAAAQSQRKAPLWALVVGTFFGAGLSPKAPGTVGSLASLVIWGPLVIADVDWWIRLAVVVAIFALGTAAAARIVAAEGKEDPQIVVADEVAGMGVTLLLSAHGVVSLVLGFALFRLFDIWKPWPVSVADRQLKGGFGAMFDDVVAGAYALLVLFLLERFALPHITQHFNAGNAL